MKKIIRTLFIFSTVLSMLTALTAVPAAAASKTDSQVPVVTYATAAWFDTGWLYRKTVTISGSTSDLTDYQVEVPVSFSTGKMNPDFSDIRFTAADSTTLLNYWLESSIASTSAVFWVKVPSIPTAGTYILLYYGKATAISASDSNNTFIAANNDFEQDAAGTAGYFDRSRFRMGIRLWQPAGIPQ
jgi:hypothetical protein